MAKFPFTNFFNVNGNGKMDFSEELLAMKVFEDSLPEDNFASYDEFEENLDDGWGDTEFEDEISPMNSSLGLTSLEKDNMDRFYEDEEEDLWDDPQDEDEESLWQEPLEEQRPMAYPTFSVESQEERYAKQGIWREDYPNQRTYDAACELADLRKGEGYVPQNSTCQKEMEKRQFILSGGCAAAR